MAICCVCQFTSRSGQEIFKNKVGKPPEQISEILSKCTDGESDDLVVAESQICRKCCERLLRYQKTIKMLEQIKQEVLQLMRGPRTKANTKTKRKRDGTETKDLKDVSFLEVKVENETVEPYADAAGRDQSEEIFLSEDLVKFEYSVDMNLADSNIVTRDTLDGNELPLRPTAEDLNGFDEFSDGGLKLDETSADSDFLPPKTKKKKKNGSQGKGSCRCSSCVNTTLGEDAVSLKIEPVQKKCPDCDETFACDRLFETHINRKHFKGFICEHCGKVLATKGNLKIHCEEVHQLGPQFKCPECDEQFYRKLQFEAHVSRHTNETPLQCKLCPRSFSHKLALRRHSYYHVNRVRRPYECEVCKMNFALKYHVKRHMITHSGQKPHCCPLCSKCFAYSYGLNLHMKEHENPGSTKQKRYRCGKCPRTFTNAVNYEDHCRENACVNKRGAAAI